MTKQQQHLLNAARLAVANFEQWRASDGDAGSAFMMIAAMEKLGKAVDEVDKNMVRPEIMADLERDIAEHGELWKELAKR